MPSDPRDRVTLLSRYDHVHARQRREPATADDETDHQAGTGDEW